MGQLAHRRLGEADLWNTQCTGGVLGVRKHRERKAKAARLTLKLFEVLCPTDVDTSNRSAVLNKPAPRGGEVIRVIGAIRGD